MHISIIAIGNVASIITSCEKSFRLEIKHTRKRLLLYFSIFKVIFLRTKPLVMKKTCFTFFDLFFYKINNFFFRLYISSEKPGLRARTCRTLTLAFHAPVEMLQDAYYNAHPCVSYKSYQSSICFYHATVACIYHRTSTRMWKSKMTFSR